MIPADFAQHWEAAWNSHDIRRIMAHYAPDVTFRSRKAIPLTGAGELRGAKALEAYWSAALAKQPDLKFTVTMVFTGHDMLTLGYTNHAGVQATETLYFNADGLVTQAAACHADLVSAPPNA